MSSQCIYDAWKNKLKDNLTQSNNYKIKCNHQRVRHLIKSDKAEGEGWEISKIAITGVMFLCFNI